MSNTVIQIKRSLVTNTPPNGSLSAGELAISYASDKLFSGNSAGTGVDEIGGKFYVDMTQLAYAQANTARDQANTALTTGQSAFAKANTAGTDAVNSFDNANNSYAQANTARSHANAAFAAANTVATNLDSANTFLQSYADSTEADAKAYANSTFLPLSGGTVTGDLDVVGNLSISGNTYYVNVEEYRVDDPLIYLAGNNYTSDIVDIGFIANYNDGTANLHTGLYREHEDKMYYLFQGYDAEPANNHIGAFSNNMTLAVLNADLKTSNLVLGGVNAISWITSSFNKANTVGTDLAAANTFLQTFSSNATNLTTGTVPSGRISGSYTGITGVGTLTAGTWNGSTIGVPYGGTGLTTVATNGILYGQGTSALSVASAGSEGQVLQAGASGVPAFGDLDGGTF